MKQVGMLNSMPITMTRHTPALCADNTGNEQTLYSIVHNREHGQMAWPHMPRL